MVELGFRPPQFSEDLAWVPAWLQPNNQLDESYDHDNQQQQEGGDNYPNLSKQDTCLKENGYEGKGLNLSTEDCRFNGFRLVLTGEENSPESLSAPSGNVPQLHLYLSTCSVSQDKSNLFLSTSQMQLSSNVNLGAHLVDDVVRARPRRQSEGECESNSANLQLTSISNSLKNVECEHNLANLPSTSISNGLNNIECEHNSANVHLTSIPSNVKNFKGIPVKDSYRRYGEDDKNFLKADNIEDAIELSIAASEALVIHEMAKKDSDAENLLGGVLEMSLRMKQARIEGLKTASPDRIDHSDENNCLPDLDDIAMAEALKDVGLEFSNHSCHLTNRSAILPVQDVPGTEYCEISTPGKSEETSVVDDQLIKGIHLETCISELPNRRSSEETLVVDDQLIKGIHLETCISELPNRRSSEETSVVDDQLWKGIHLETNMSELAVNHPVKNIHTANRMPCTSPELYLLPQENTDATAIAKLFDSSKVDITASQHEDGVKTPKKLENDGEYEEAQLASNRHTSRWLGGWGKKESKFPVQHSDVDPQSTFKFFVGETSTLSESADLAPDENSIIQAQKIGSDELSQTSKFTKELCNIDKDGQLLSQAIVGSSSLSPGDPLCSFVPCSITSADAESGLSQNKCEGKINVGESEDLSLDNGIEKLQEKSYMNVSGNAEALPRGIKEYPRTIARKHLTSLKAYSMLLPTNNPLSNEEVVNSSRPLLSKCKHDCHCVNQMGVYSKSSDNKGSGSFLLSKSASGNAAEFNAESTIVPQKGCHIETAIDGIERNIDPPEEKRLPVIFDRQLCNHLQAYEPYVNHLINEKTSIPVLEAQTLPKLQKNEDLQDVLSEHNTSKGTQNPARKRVHFADAAVELQHITDQKGPQISKKYSSTNGAGKRPRRSYLLQESRNYDVKRQSRACAYTIKKRFILRGIEFLLTGFSCEKRKNIEDMIRNYGGMVLHEIPPPPNSRMKKSSRFILPVILCSKKLQTTTFLYGCAVNAFILQVDWLFDSVAEGSVQSCAKYMIIENRLPDECSQIGMPIRLTKQQYIFHGVGIMLHGSNGLCTKFEKVIKHGGGKVFKTLRGLVCSLDAGRISVAALVVQNETKPLRHLKYCVSEKNIPVTSCSWIVESLHKGKVLPLMETKNSSSAARPKTQKFLADLESSQEI